MSNQGPVRGFRINANLCIEYLTVCNRAISNRSDQSRIYRPQPRSGLEHCFKIGASSFYQIGETWSLWSARSRLVKTSSDQKNPVWEFWFTLLCVAWLMLTMPRLSSCLCVTLNTQILSNSRLSLKTKSWLCFTPVTRTRTRRRRTRRRRTTTRTPHQNLSVGGVLEGWNLTHRLLMGFWLSLGG